MVKFIVLHKLDGSVVFACVNEIISYFPSLYGNYTDVHAYDSYISKEVGFYVKETVDEILEKIREAI